jgi:O-antigen/teichoic acid export membrane protein
MKNSKMTERTKLIHGLFVVGLGLAVPQVLAYIASVFAARLLLVEDVGAFGALQGITQIATPLGLAIQAITARRIVKDFHYDHKELLQFGLKVAIVLLFITSVISIPLTSILNIRYLILFLTIGSVAPAVMISTQIGIAQGKEWYFRLAGIYILFGLGRSILTIVALLIKPELISVGIGFFVGSIISAFAAHYILGDSRKFWKVKGSDNYTRELWKASQVLFALYFLLSIDVLLARVVLRPEESGIYTVGVLVSKIAFFTPQAIIVVLFPKMSKNNPKVIRLALLITLLIGVSFIIVCYIAAPFIVNAIGGPSYYELYSEVWLFAVEGSLFAILQVLLYGRIAREETKVSIYLWIGAVMVIMSVWMTTLDTIKSIVLSLIVVTFILVIIALVTELRIKTIK